MDNQYLACCRTVIDEVKKRKITDQKKLNNLKIEILEQLGKNNLKRIPKNAEILNAATEDEREELGFVLSMKPVRTIAGVSVVAIMTKPWFCPHGTCTFCPGGPKSPFGPVPQSYTGKEPTTRRAIRNHYDSYLQVFNRLEQYVVTNKIPDKVDIIVMGGTFPAMPKYYQEEFIISTFQALNDFSTMFFIGNKLNLKEFLYFF